MKRKEEKMIELIVVPISYKIDFKKKSEKLLKEYEV